MLSLLRDHTKNMNSYVGSLNAILSSIGLGGQLFFSGTKVIRLSITELGEELYTFRNVSTVRYEVPSVLLESVSLHDSNSLSSPEFIDIQAELFPIVLIYLYCFMVRDITKFSLLLSSLDSSQLDDLWRTSIQLGLEGLSVLCQYPFMFNQDFFSSGGTKVKKGQKINNDLSAQPIYLPKGNYTFTGTDINTMIVGAGIDSTILEIRSAQVPTVNFCTVVLPFHSTLMGQSEIRECKVLVNSSSGLSISDGSSTRILRSHIQSRTTCLECNNCSLELLFSKLSGTLGIKSTDSRINIRSLDPCCCTKIIDSQRSDVAIGIEGQDNTTDIIGMIDKKASLDYVLRFPSVPPEFYEPKTP